MMEGIEKSKNGIKEEIQEKTTGKKELVIKKNIRAKVTAIKVLGNNTNHREKSLRWSIGRNTHLKKISEKFEQGNLWYTLIFDYIKDYKEEKKKLESKKEEYEQARLILEEN